MKTTKSLPLTVRKAFSILALLLGVYLVWIMLTSHVSQAIYSCERSPHENDWAWTIRKWFTVPPNPKNVRSFSKPESEVFLYGRLGQPSLIDLLFREKTNGYFIEAGAWDGESESNSLFFELKRNWTGALVEPNKQNMALMMQKHRHATLIEACFSMSNTYEVVDFLNMGNLGGISSIEEDELMKRLRGEDAAVHNQVTTPVHCFSLYDVLLSLGNPSVDLFSLDIEGAEIPVLQSIPWHKVDIKMFLIEMYHYVGEKETAIKNIFLSNGYKIGPELFPTESERNHPVNPNYDLIFYRSDLDIETNIDCTKFMGGYQGKQFRWGSQTCISTQ